MTKADTSSSERIDWVQSVPFLLMHLTLLIPLFTGVSWEMVLLCVGSYYLRMFGVTAGYHRYFSHRAYKTGRVMQFLMAFLAQTSVQKGVLWWASHHRHHHKYSDTDLDVHSPVKKGFWWSHVGWIMSVKYSDTAMDKVKDLAKFPELVWLNEWKHIPTITYAAVITAIWGWDGLLWGFFISTVLLYHGVFTINSLAHVFGSRRYETSDTSRNNLLLALLTMGEGWHNNHHHYQSTANQGWFWWEIDLSYYALKAMSWMGLVWDLRLPPRRLLEVAKSPKTGAAEEETSPAASEPEFAA